MNKWKITFNLEFYQSASIAIASYWSKETLVLQSFQARVQTWYKSLVGIHNFSKFKLPPCRARGWVLSGMTRLLLSRSPDCSLLLTLMLYFFFFFFFFTDSVLRETAPVLSRATVPEDWYWNRGHMFIPITQSVVITGDLMEVLCWKWVMLGGNVQPRCFTLFLSSPLGYRLKAFLWD